MDTFWKENMKKIEEMEKEEPKEAEPIVKPNLRAIAGGRKPPGFNYLRDMPVGTEFLVKNVGNKFVLYDFYLVHKTPDSKSCYLCEERDEEESFSWVDPIEFCQLFELHEQLGNVENE